MGGVAVRWASLVNVFAGSCCIRPAGWPSYVSSGAIHRRNKPAQGDSTGLAAMSGRELEVAKLVLDRRTNREIAEKCVLLNTKTVETHIRNIFDKLGVSSHLLGCRCRWRIRGAAARPISQTGRLTGAPGLSHD
jgi:DNA-binding NarL/FixJ family response regulator